MCTCSCLPSRTIWLSLYTISKSSVCCAETAVRHMACTYIVPVHMDSELLQHKNPMKGTTACLKSMKICACNVQSFTYCSRSRTPLQHADPVHHRDDDQSPFLAGFTKGVRSRRPAPSRSPGGAVTRRPSTLTDTPACGAT